MNCGEFVDQFGEYCHLNNIKSSSPWTWGVFRFLFFVFKFIYLFRVREGERERQGANRGGAEKEREENPKQAPCCQCRVWRGARCHKLWDYDLSQNREPDAQLTEALRCPGMSVYLLILFTSLFYFFQQWFVVCSIWFLLLIIVFSFVKGFHFFY